MKRCASQLHSSHQTKRLKTDALSASSEPRSHPSFPRAVADIDATSCDQDLVPISNMEEGLRKIPFIDLHSLCSAVTDTFGFTYVRNSDNVIFIKLNSSCTPTVLMSLTIDSDYINNIHVLGRKISSTHALWSSIPHLSCSVQTVEYVLQKLSSYSVCTGVNDSELVSLVQHSTCKSGALRKCSCSYADNADCVCIISVDCELLLAAGGRCGKCCLLRKRLLMRNKRKRLISPSKLASCRKPNLLLTTPMKLSKLTQYARIRRRLNRKVTVLTSKVKMYQEKCIKLIQTEGENLGTAASSDLLQIMEDCKETAISNFEPGSFQRIFFEQQLKYNSLKKKSSMRWHPAVIRWCLFVKSKSSAAFDCIRSFLNLPSKRTLYDYSHYTEHGTGINPKVIEQLISTAASLGCFTEQHKSYVGILVDEVKIKSDLIYHKTTGELIGYVHLDRVSNEMQHLHNVVEGAAKKLAQSLLVVMVRGITTNLKYPIAVYATTTATSTSLYNIIYECIECLEIVAGLKVLYICCDGATSNRRFFHMHNDDIETYKINNPYSSDSREIFFVSDPPHLLKTVRNCFANSFAHSKSRTLWFDNDISWLHVTKLYEQHCELSEFRICPKLTRKHINLTSFSKMRVSLAAQVLSQTVANGLRSVYGQSVKSTIEFIEIINKWFDIVNVKHLFEGRNTRNLNLAPFTNVDDERLHWLESDFLSYFDKWKVAVNNRSGKFTSQQKERMQLSSQTILGLKITSKSIAGIVKTLLKAGASFVLTNHINQDPLEQLFGHCRHKAGSNDNPNVQQACHLINNIRTVGSQAVPNKLGNTVPTFKKQLDFTPVPKRSSHQ